MFILYKLLYLAQPSLYKQTAPLGDMLKTLDVTGQSYSNDSK